MLVISIFGCLINEMIKENREKHDIKYRIPFLIPAYIALLMKRLKTGLRQGKYISQVKACLNLRQRSNLVVPH